METKSPSPLPERNPKTHASHRREVFWQITFPLALVSMIFLALSVGVIWAGVAGSGELTRWAGVSIVWLSLPVIILSLLMLALVRGLVYGVTKLLHVLPGYARLAQDFFVRVQNKVKALADKIVEPFFKVHGFGAAVKTLKPRRRK